MGQDESFRTRTTAHTGTGTRYVCFGFADEHIRQILETKESELKAAEERHESESMAREVSVRRELDTVKSKCSLGQLWKTEFCSQRS